jgi:hypothetical protein
MQDASDGWLLVEANDGWQIFDSRGSELLHEVEPDGLSDA